MRSHRAVALVRDVPASLVRNASYSFTDSHGLFTRTVRFLPVTPLGRGAAVFAGAAAFVGIIALVLVSGGWRGEFRTDEAHKVSETAFLRLWLRGDVRNPAWFANLTDRTNPPVGKYVFGAAILAAGQRVPPLPTLAVHTPNGVPPIHATALSDPYLPLLRAARFASAMATALTALLLTALLARYHGSMSAAAAFALFALNPLTRSFCTWAVFDPLLALFFMSAIALTTSLATPAGSRRVAVLAVSLGAVTSLAFQTRLNGLFALFIALPFVWWTARRAIRGALSVTTFVGSAFVIATLALNPFYWSTPAVPLEPFSSHAGLLRPAMRLLQQKHDLEQLAAALQDGGSWQRVAANIAFFGETMLSELAGVLTTIAAIGGVIALKMRRRSLAPQMRCALLTSLAVAATMVATLPLPWPRYLVVVQPPLTLIAAYGTAEMMRALAAEFETALKAKSR